MLGGRLGPAMLQLASLVVLATLLAFPMPASAFDLNYGGRLAGPTGEPLAGPVDLTFRFYRDPAGGSALVTVNAPNVPLADGIFQVGLPIAPEDADRLFEDGDQTIFVEVESQGKVYPRQKFSYVPLALRVPVDGTKIIYDSQGRLTLGPGTTPGTLPGVLGTGVVEKTGDQSYTTFPLSPAGKSLMGAATSAEQRTALGLGTMAQKNSISPGDLASSTCAAGTVLRKGPSGWGCEMLGPADLSSLVSQTEFDYLDGVTSPIQDQLDHRLPSAGGTLSGSLTLSQGSEVRLATTNAGISAGFKAPANLPTSTIYTLPSGVPTDGQMLTSSSSGLLSWSNVPVTSVNGLIGSVFLNADNINETASRKYYSHTLARQALSSAGLLSYNPSTGVMSLSDTLLTKSGGTMTGSLDFAGTLKVTNLADPTADGDATKKAYVDGKLGGQPLVVGTPSPGQVVKWDGSKFALASDDLGQAGGGIASLNTLTSGSQSLAVDIPGVSAGTRPSWAAESATSTHRLTIPMASTNGVTAGLIAKTDYDVFSGKQDGITPSSTIVLGSVSTNLQNALEIKPYGTSAAQTGEMRFRELNTSGVNYVGLKSPDNLATNTIWTLPSQDGTNGFVLSTDGSGSLSWISPTTGSVTSVATGTGLAGGPISGAGTISLANVGTAGTYTKVTTNAQGQVISGSSLADTDIPNLPAAKITSGTLAVDRGGTGAATAQPFFVLAGPGVGPTAGAPSFRTLMPADIPSLDASKITSGTLSNSLINWAAAPVTTVAGRTGAVTLTTGDISGTMTITSGGTGATNAAAARTNLGLGTAATLDVGTAANNILQLDGSGKLPVVDGSQLAGVVKIAGNSTMTGTLTLPSNGLIAGTNQLVLSGGNVGIGTTSPLAPLHLSGYKTLNTFHTSLALDGGTSASLTGLQFMNGGTQKWVFSSRGGFDTPNDRLSLWDPTQTERVTFLSGGNVGIGTLSPSATLDVSGIIKASSLDIRGTIFSSAGSVTGGSIGLYNTSKTTNGTANLWAIYNTTGLYGNSLQFYAYDTLACQPGGLCAPRFTIMDGGNVGIGTHAPTAALEVVGNVKVSGTVTQSVPMIYSTSTNSITQIPTTWTSMSSLVTLSDNVASGISRTNSTFTFPTPGVYFVMATLVYVNNSASQYVGMRMRRTNGIPTTLVQNTSWAAATTGSQAILQGLMSIAANDTVDFQHIASGTASIGWGSTNLGGENTVTVSITIYKMQ